CFVQLRIAKVNTKTPTAFFSTLIGAVQIIVESLPAIAPNVANQVKLNESPSESDAIQLMFRIRAEMNFSWTSR
ncbi:MAG: hypothetical protein M0C28_37240, partial [Candidatus Moduliflexus flocculans]|nr:hypothetical protein [Candidatus Moduliflexus flocculans]